MQNLGIKLDPVQSRELSYLIDKSTTIITVTFLKSGNIIRKMNCKKKVDKHLKGGKSTLDDSKYTIVWDIPNKGYRAINRETILEVRGI